nr:hypothetical protein Iba_chr03aCG4110 [Ipomoea batatas]
MRRYIRRSHRQSTCFDDHRRDPSTPKKGSCCRELIVLLHACPGILRLALFLSLSEETREEDLGAREREARGTNCHDKRIPGSMQATTINCPQQLPLSGVEGSRAVIVEAEWTAVPRRRYIAAMIPSPVNGKAAATLIFFPVAEHLGGSGIPVTFFRSVVAAARRDEAMATMVGLRWRWNSAKAHSPI